jgi:hypothetical protein
MWLLGLWVLAQATEEQGLIDPTIEDRDTHLDALGDHVPPFQTGLSRKLCGRQVICHRSSSSFAAYMSEVCRARRMDSTLCPPFCLLRANFEAPLDGAR